MKALSWKLASFLCALLASASIGSTHSSAQEATSTTATPTPSPGAMLSETPPQAEEPRKAKAFKPVSFAWSLGMGVPIILDVPRSVVRPGANIFFFGAADFGFFMVGGDVGLQWNPIDFGSGFTPPGSSDVLSGRGPLTRIYLSAPEVRFQVPDLPVVLPYISGAFDMNFWNFRETAVGCGYWYCSRYSVYRFTPGFTGKAGLGFEIKESGVHIDVAFQFSFTGKGNFFDDSGWWLAPVIGVLIRQ